MAHKIPFDWYVLDEKKTQNPGCNRWKKRNFSFGIPGPNNVCKSSSWWVTILHFGRVGVGFDPRYITSTLCGWMIFPVERGRQQTVQVAASSKREATATTAAT